MNPPNSSCRGKRMRMNHQYNHYVQHVSKPKSQDCPSLMIAGISPPSPFLPDVPHEGSKPGVQIKIENLKEKGGITLPSSPPSMPRLRYHTRVSLKPKSQLSLKKCITPFVPVQSTSPTVSSRTTTEKSRGSMVDSMNEMRMNISSNAMLNSNQAKNTRDADLSKAFDSSVDDENEIEELVLAVPSTPFKPSRNINDILGLSKKSHPSQKSYLDTSQTNGLFHQLPASDRSAVMPGTTLRSSSRTPPPTCQRQRRKKPSGYQQAGRDDSEEGEDSNEDGDRCYYNSLCNASMSDRENPFINGVYNHGHNYGNGRPHATPKRRSDRFGHVLPQNRYPFSPNPFSPQFSPNAIPNQIPPLARSSPHIALHKNNNCNFESPDRKDRRYEHSCADENMAQNSCNKSKYSQERNVMPESKDLKNIFSSEDNVNCGTPLSNKGFKYDDESYKSTPNMSNKVMDNSFDSSSASPMCTEYTYGKHKKLQVDCVRANKTYDDVKNTNERISPTDILDFPPPQTPCKGHAFTRNVITWQNDDFDFLHNNLQGDNNFKDRFSSLNDNDNLLPSTSTSPSTYQHQRFPISRFASDFEEVGQLGTGSFGTVYKCMSRLDGCMYAIKTGRRRAKGIADRDRMLKEVYALAALCDKSDTGTFHIVRYHQAWMEEDRLFIQTELCNSTLEEELKSGVLARCIPRRFKLLREILLALELIHRNNMVHLDIKPENIFIKGDQYKLGDFGLVTKATTEDDVEEGDSRYMSLELLSGDHKDLTKVRGVLHRLLICFATTSNLAHITFFYYKE